MTLIVGNLESFHGTVGRDDYLRLIVGRTALQPGRWCEWIIDPSSPEMTWDGHKLPNGETLIMRMLSTPFARVTLHYEGGFLNDGLQPSYMSSDDDAHLTHILRADFETTDRPDR